MSVQFSNELNNYENNVLSAVALTTKPAEAQSEWYKWNVVHILACIFSPLLITIPLIFHANQKKAHALAQEQAAFGLAAYRHKDWKAAIDHLQQLNDSPLKDVFKNKVYETLPSRLNEEDNVLLGREIRVVAQEGVSGHPGVVVYPSDASVSAIPLSWDKGHDNTTIVLAALIGCAYLHQAFDELAKPPSPTKKMQTKAFTVLSTQYLGCTRARVTVAMTDLENIKQALRRL